MGEPHPSFSVTISPAEPEQSAKEDKEMTLETDLKLGETQLCLSCDEVKPLTDGDCLIRYGVFVEFNCYQCQQKKTQQQQKDEKFLEMMDDFSDVIAKHFPNFDNNIEASTWAFLVLFTEETIHQLGKETN
jgi:hypothetical protein